MKKFNLKFPGNFCIFISYILRKLQKLIIIFVCCLFAGPIFATHNRAGEITYCHISGFKYGITVTTYTDGLSCPADRCELEIFYGDGSSDTISRVNGGPCTNNCGQCPKCGEIIVNESNYVVKKNIYYVEHVFSGAGEFEITVEDPNRNENVVNIPNSVNVSFFLKTTLTIFPGLGNNCSPVLANPPIDRGCVGLPYLHNPGAIDPDDGDSLVYSLVPSVGNEGTEIDGYVFPHEYSGCEGSSLEIDPVTGTLIWDSPQCQGEYNVAILIEEYRDGIKVGSILRDMQINILVDCNNNPPVIEVNNEVCAVAGDTINEPVLATDPDTMDVIELTGIGEPLELAISPASFLNVAGQDSVSSNFYWETTCDHVRSNKYFMNFKAEDNNPEVPLVDFETMSISIIAPAVETFEATAQGGEILLDWSEAPCSNASCYKIYRRIDSSGYVPSDCETGVPSYTGYSLLSQVSGYNNTSFLDNDPALVHGHKYCYLVTSCFDDGNESQASEEICLKLKRDVPIITNVSVEVTDLLNGRDSIKWTNPTELDTTVFLPPYQYNVYRGDGFSGTTELIHEGSPFNHFNLADTLYLDTTINTLDSAHIYRIEILSSGESIGFSSTASSVYLNSVPTDNVLILNWTENVPWVNTKYIIYKEDDLGSFNILDTVPVSFYQDTGLKNNKEYCYYIESIGGYSEEDLPYPLLNKSQIHCNFPIDNVAPCAPPGTDGTAFCDVNQSKITWINPNDSCSDDVVGYYIYYSPKIGDPFSRFDSIFNAQETSYILEDSVSIAGCFKVTAIDTFYNESTVIDSVCVDNCPLYTLPNVFTPGKDGYNDLFRPFPYKYIHSIRLTVYNRWGEPVFKTTDPDILWDGTHMKSGKLCSNGLYYYTCEVYAIRLAGLERMELEGLIYLLPEEEKQSLN